jgi:glucose-1-phosphatase
MYSASRSVDSGADCRRSRRLTNSCGVRIAMPESIRRNAKIFSVKIEAILFDLGKVIIDFNFELGMQRWAGNCRLSREEFERVIWAKDWIRRYERGEISTADYHRYLCDVGTLQMELEEFRQSWSEVFMPDLIVSEALLADLKRNYPLILVSNTNEVHVEFVAARYKVFDYFDHKIFSHEVGSLKPDRKIFEAAIAASGRPADALFFTDDREENVQAATRLGMHAHQFVSESALIEALRAHGVAVSQ